MAYRALQIIASVAVILFVSVPLIAVWGKAESTTHWGPAEWQALRFTLIQASLSALLSVMLAIPVARALARSQFWGRQWLILMLGAPFILPTLVAILGLIAVFGQRGLLNGALTSLGFESISIYGLQGVLLAHVFFNLPLATRMILLGWVSLPAERIRLAQSLNLTPWQRFCAIEWPMLRAVLPSTAAVIFIICLSSFAVALTLGGGPKSTTIELAIYQAIRFEFDFALATSLGLVQLLLSGGAAYALLLLGRQSDLGGGLDRSIVDNFRSFRERGLDSVIIVLASAFLLFPLALIAWKGIAGINSLPYFVWEAAGRSLVIALSATLLCLLLAAPLCTRGGEMIGTLGIAISPLVLGTGLFLILRPYINPFDVALLVTIFVNAVMSLPFVLRILRPQVETIHADYKRLSSSLGFTSIDFLRWVLLPRLKRSLAFAAGLSAALSMGDLGVIALFGDAENATLPLKLYQLMGSYRMEHASAAAVLLLLLSLGLFAMFNLLGRDHNA